MESALVKKQYRNEMDLCSDLMRFLKEANLKTPYLFVEFSKSLSVRLVKYFEDEKSFSAFAGSRKTLYPRFTVVADSQPYYEFYGETVGVIFEKNEKNDFFIQTYRKLKPSVKGLNGSRHRSRD